MVETDQWHTVFEDGSYICPWGGCPDCPGTVEGLIEEIEEWLREQEGRS